MLILMSTVEKVVRLVEQLEGDFEKYHTCAAFKRQTLAGPSDSQRVAQSLSSEIMLVVVLDEALFEILDHKNSRRLLYKIRDISKCGRAVFVKYQVKVERYRISGRNYREQVRMFRSSPAATFLQSQRRFWIIAELQNLKKVHQSG
uniref:Uncharacterized protein LOC111129921 isoform X2 n=1 Tax=Crassostrea virginica TaxID=6565 RepID=A0A8B8DX35_CRAVI|nr:uncharacterized protein LOC111129921 isoform X2 [Crassostrea virginica]